MNLSIFILAAGLGERLRPITNHIPKPLLPILGKPVLESILEKVFSLPINNIGINLHHKKKAIENWIKQSAFSKNIEFFPENPILGTGGAFKNAEAFLKNSTFLVHNSDIISDIDLEQLIEYHLSSKNLVTLAVHDYPEFNRLEIDEQGFLKNIMRKHPHPNLPPSMGRGTKENSNSKWGDANNKTYPSFGRGVIDDNSPSPGRRGLGGGGDEQLPPQTETNRLIAFTGIAVYEPEFLKFLSIGVSSVVDAWLKAISAGYKIGTLDVSGCYWSDIGTPASYAKAIIDELGKNGEMVYIHPSVKRCEYIEMDGYVVIEKESVTNKGVSIRNCIMLPGNHTKSDSHYENCILGPGFKIDLGKSEVLGFWGNVDALHIGTGGSDRKYYRENRFEKSAVLMKCAAGDKDFQRHIEYTRFFQRHSIPVPELIDVEPDKMSAVFEDLGDLSLYSWLKCPREEDQIVKMYKRVIDILILIHTTATEHVSECPLLKNRIFDYEYLRWETGYFIERFVEGIRNIKVKNLSVLNDEFHRMAMKVDAFPKSVIHRDFQSQNIMITKRGIPRILDYQGARIGPPAYDLASILWDPYYRLKDNTREKLLDYYIYNIPSQNPAFASTLLPCRLQRHMQALGAYGFLSKVKGKKYFLKYIPEGLRLLKEDVLLSKDEYPGLYDLTVKL